MTQPSHTITIHENISLDYTVRLFIRGQLIEQSTDSVLNAIDRIEEWDIRYALPKETIVTDFEETQTLHEWFKSYL